MSLYNMLHGVNPLSDIILASLGLTSGDFGRFRDVYMDQDESGNDRIRVHTRCGGGNRESYEDVIDTMRGHKHFLFDEDDDFDCTYCDFVFSVPEHAK